MLLLFFIRIFLSYIVKPCFSGGAWNFKNSRILERESEWVSENCVCGVAIIHTKMMSFQMENESVWKL